MSGSRHFTVVDDWVILNQEINSTEFRVYAILRAAVLNQYGGIPTTGIRVTAGWVSKISGDLFSRTTAQRALRGLASKGVLGRLNDPKEGGEGAEFEFIVYPGDDYTGVRNIQAEAAKLKKKATRSISFDPVRIEGNPKNGLTRDDHVKPSSGDILGRPEDPELPDEEQEPPQEEEEHEFDVAALERLGHGEGPAPTEAMTEFAAELEQVTAKNKEPRLRLLRGQCERIAEASRPALEHGWEPEVLARRLASELNPRIHSPQQFLVRKLEEVDGPPPKRRMSTLERDPAEADRVTIDQVDADEEARARVEAAKARYQENLLARQMAGRKKF